MLARKNERKSAASRRLRPHVYSGEYVETTSASALSAFRRGNRNRCHRINRLFELGVRTNNGRNTRGLEPNWFIPNDWNRPSDARTSAVQQASDLRQRRFRRRGEG